jgi:hypothetical protein
MLYSFASGLSGLLLFFSDLSTEVEEPWPAGPHQVVRVYAEAIAARLLDDLVLRRFTCGERERQLMRKHRVKACIEPAIPKFGLLSGPDPASGMRDPVGFFKPLHMPGLFEFGGILG